jgi:hypothetical protein
LTYTVIELRPRFEEKRVFDVSDSTRKFVDPSWKAKSSDFFIEKGITKARCWLSVFYHVMHPFPIPRQKIY